MSPSPTRVRKGNLNLKSCFALRQLSQQSKAQGYTVLIKVRQIDNYLGVVWSSPQKKPAHTPPCMLFFDLDNRNHFPPHKLCQGHAVDSNTLRKLLFLRLVLTSHCAMGQNDKFPPSTVISSFRVGSLCNVIAMRTCGLSHSSNTCVL